jgi:hypothetical protein
VTVEDSAGARLCKRINVRPTETESAAARYFKTDSFNTIDQKRPRCFRQLCMGNQTLIHFEGNGSEPSRIAERCLS